MITIITGLRGAGKTTFLLKRIDELKKKGNTPSGIMTPAIYNKEGVKVGFFALDVATGEKWELGRSDRTLDGPSYGPFSFSERGFVKANKILKQVLSKGSGDVFLDEIGPLELEKGYGFTPVLSFVRRFKESRSLYMVIRQSLINKFIIEYIGTRESRVVEVTRENRELIQIT